MCESLGTLLVSWYLASNTLVALHLFSVARILVFPDSLGSECFTGTFDQTSHKHDAAADWNAWLSEVPLNFSAITDPSAPHHFRICRRCHLSSHDLASAKLTCSQLREAESQDDLMLALCQFMLDPRTRLWFFLPSDFFLPSEWDHHFQFNLDIFHGRSSKQFENMFSEKRQLHMKKQF